MEKQIKNHKTNKSLTLAELQEMHAMPAWCVEEQCYGLICVEDGGQWKDIPFFHYIDPGHNGHRTDCTFSLNIIDRGLTLYRRKPKMEA